MSCLVNSQEIKLEYKCSNTAVATSESTCTGEYEIICLTAGRGRCIIEGSELNIGPRSLILFPPMTYHTLIIEPSVSSERYVLHFSADALTPDAAQILDAFISDNGRGGFFPEGTVSEMVISAIERLEASRELTGDTRDYYLRAVLTELLIFISANRSERIVSNDEELGSRVLRYLNENIDKDLSLDRLSTRFFVSKYYLCRAFKKQNGVSIHSYVNHKRIMYAKSLIESGETASDAAYKVGFGDYSAFYRAYVKLVGHSPTRDNRKEKI